jgi:diguanylate cyclase (GGDEF)-like protein
MRTPELIKEFLVSVQQLSNAESAALLVHMEPPEPEALLLAAEGGEVVAELADHVSAWDLLSARNDSAGASVAVFECSDGKGVLIRLALNHILARPQGQRREVNERRSAPEVITAPPIDGALWIGLREPDQDSQFMTRIRRLTDPDPDPAAAEDWLGRFVNLSAKLTWNVYQLTNSLQDPVSQLAAQREDQPVGLLLVNPDDFGMINHRFGREFGDAAVREVADQMASCLRGTDGVFRYGGAVFGAVLPGTGLAQSQAAAEKVRRFLSKFDYLDGTVRLTFSIGAAVAQPEDFKREPVEAADMLKRADAALNMAKLSGGSRVIAVQVDDSNQVMGHLDPLSGIFTADTEKDYRNMLLLWETVGLVSSHPEPEAIAQAFVDRLALGFRPDRLALFTLGDESAVIPLATNVRDDNADDGRVSGREVRLDQSRIELINQCVESQHAERAKLGDDEKGATTAYAVPLVARDETIGCLYLDGAGRRLHLDSSDLIFLNALADQLAVALDRAQLAARWIREKDRESRQLRSELRELRQALHHSKMVYQSSQMHEVLETLRRVAPSDATVLIIGESGTGKEMLAQTLHELSDRSEAALVTVDCGAIAHSLVDAELFGHVKGAYTGAESASEGRIVQAEGGTIFLDEIGELPLDVQTKLLRFVQEKQITPVGGHETRTVDVRIVAATNRELADEVAAGRFRADLYYRLQVISVPAVPLRDRPDDIQPLAHYFLEKFATQYGSGVKHLSSSAEQRLQHYHWPGNVRELQHCMLRAVLMSDDDIIDEAGIELHPEAPSHSNVNLVVKGHQPPFDPSDPVENIADLRAAEPRPAETQSVSSLEGRPNGDISGIDPWTRLQQILELQVSSALSKNATRPVPIGRWLGEDLVLAASSASNEIARQAAKLVGLAESTYRRQLDKLRADLDAGIVNRTPSWEDVEPVVAALIEAAAADPGADILDRARLVLLDIVQREVHGRTSVGAALMGVTPPTYKRWLEARAA